MIIGYTAGVYDLFHVGHLNLLRNAKGMCDKLIVGVTTDDLVSYKNKKPVIPFEERLEIIRGIRYVDAGIPQVSLDKYVAWERIRYNVLFVGDDWFASDRWQDIEGRLQVVGVRVVYFPYTKGTSSTLINNVLSNLRQDGTVLNATPEVRPGVS
jgi:glycerol-3-phosphate cytidylyltransferase